MPPPMRCQNTPSKPKGIATTPRIPIGITATETTNVAGRLPNAVVRQPVKVALGGVKPRCETRDQRGQQQAKQFAHAL